MICNTFRKESLFGMNKYYPVLKDYIHSEQFKTERGRFGFEVPAELKCKKALPTYSFKEKSFPQELSFKSEMMATALLELFMSEISNGYPEVVCTEIERGKYLKFKFSYFRTFDFMNVTFAHYKPVGVITKKAAKKYLVCIDQE